MRKFGVPFHPLAVATTGAYAMLLYSQLHTHVGAYPSDVVLHLRGALDHRLGEAMGYSLLHHLTERCARLLAESQVNPLVLGGAGMLVLLCGATYGTMAALHQHWTRVYPASFAWQSALLPLAALMVSMLILTPLTGYYYLGVFTPNPWHNPTYIFGRFFAVVALLAFWSLLQAKAVHWRSPAWWVASVAGALATWAKPSFLLPLLPATILLLAWEHLRQRMAAGRAAWVAAAWLPAMIGLWFLRRRIYDSPTAANEVVFSFGQVWSLYASNIPLTIVLGNAFPLYVAAVSWRRSGLMLRLGAATFAMATLIFLLLAESGDRLTHANFAWCYMWGMFAFFLGAIDEWFFREPQPSPILRAMGAGLFLGHLLSGVLYFASILLGHQY